MNKVISGTDIQCVLRKRKTLFKVLQQALLEHTQLHEKIAENINRVMRTPGDGVVEPQIHLDANLDIPPTTCDSMMQELDQAIKTIVDQTEQDPLFERLLDEIIG